MRSRVVVGVLALAAVVGVGTTAIRASEVTAKRQWALANFVNAVQVADRYIMGPVLIVHDSEKMAQGEACTTFYRFDPVKGPQEAIVSFHCRPVIRPAVKETTLNFAYDGANGCKRLVSYQIAGDEEAHAVPR